MKKCILFLGICSSLISYGQIENVQNLPGLKKSVTCNGDLNAVSAVSLGEQRRTVTQYGQNGGTFDPQPLLSTSIEMKNSGCVIVHFSANTYIADNSVEYQVRMDGKPMEGHITSMPGNNTTPAVMEPHLGNANLKGDQMSSFSFFSKANPGKHKIEVLVAVCCSSVTDGSPVVVTDNATLIVLYNKN
jgi:hypothetical protein